MKKKKISAELLQETFPAAYVQHGLNGTRAYKSLKPYVTKETARAEAPAILALPSVQERIRALLPSEEIESGVIREAITAEVEEPMTWRDKHKYLETSLKLKGLLNNNTEKPSVQVGIIIERSI